VAIKVPLEREKGGERGGGRAVGRERGRGQREQPAQQLITVKMQKLAPNFFFFCLAYFFSKFINFADSSSLKKQSLKLIEFE
jgi:hypothetical protein